MSTKLMDMKPIVRAQPPEGLTLAEELEVAGQFAYRSGCIAEFEHGYEVVRVWYQDFTHGDGWRATKNGVPVERDHGRWGKLVEP